MKIRIDLDFSAGWVLKHKDDDPLPVAALKNMLADKFESAIVSSKQSFTSLVLVADEDVAARDKICAAVEEYIAEAYPDEDKAELIKVNVSEDIGDACEQSEGEPALAVKPAAKERSASSALEEIDSCVGCEEFKALSHEIAVALPPLVKDGAAEIFTCRNYLFSVNDGYGLRGYLRMLSSLISQSGLKGFEPSRIIEEKLQPFKDSEEPFEQARRTLHNRIDSSARLVCLDISEWIDKTDNKYFKDFLLDIESDHSEYIVVFRIPFVEKDVLDRVRASLADILYVTPVSFPPLTNAELQKCAELELGKYGFSVQKSAWPHFHERMTEEKSDGRFYGLNTVAKVARELVYNKYRSGAKPGAKTITRADMRKLCARPAEDGGAEKMLKELVGYEKIGERVDEIVAQIELALNSDSIEPPCIHMRFVGNPGTGKTTVARLLGKLLKEKGVLRVGNFFEYKGRDLCGRYVGETAPKTASICRDAYGSVLFIDEAYSLYRSDDNDRDFGREALDTLIAEMENHRSDFVVIMAGYTDDMDKLMNGNRGLLSRMPYTIEFPNFTREQLYEIYMKMLSGTFKYSPDLPPAVKEYFLGMDEKLVQSKEFSNGRFVRNLFERTWAKAAMRCQLLGKKNVVVEKEDFDRAIGEKEFSALSDKRTKIGFKIS